MGDFEPKTSKASSKAAPTAGPSQDDRFGAGKIASNLTARIIKLDIVGGRPMITIASGTTRGTHVGMEGYIKAGADLALGDFQIHEAREGVSYAFLPDLEREDIEGYLSVVINPTARPTPPTGDVKTRIIHVEVVDQGTRIKVARGKIHGITVGTTGEIPASDGGRSFTIDHVEQTRARAIVRDTADFVKAHPEAILHVQPKSARGGAVQRRANGAASTADVQSTAQAGVAGASSRLPFFDVIQRSFGKHEISGVQAQVGGPAAEASRSLGAQAYATGNRVAFASAPDLHTAAHEAAHTVQQSRGAVGFQGLGAADDEHERHADAVADAVVAGHSAEPVLDKLAHGSPNRAIQRRPEPQATNAMSSHTRFVDLQLQQLSEAAVQALLADHSPVLLERAMLVVSRTAQALNAIDSPDDTAIDAKRLFVTVDGAYAALDNLQREMTKHLALKKHVPVVAGVKSALVDRFERLGWRAPNAVEQVSRAKVAASSGRQTLTSNERLDLGLLHVRAARQQLMAGWSTIADGNVEKTAVSIRHELREANAQLLDPAHADKSVQIRTEITATELVFERVVTRLEKTDPQSLVSFAFVGDELDLLRRLVGDDAKWAERVRPAASAAKSPPAPTPTPRATVAVPAHAPGDLVSADRVDDVAGVRVGGMHDLAGFAVDPLVAQGGTRCETGNRAGCFLDTRHRDVLLANYRARVDDAQKEFHAALAELHMKVLIAKEEQEDISWVASLVLDVLSTFVVSKLAVALKVVRAAGIRTLDSMIADDYRHDLTNDPKWKIAAANMLDKVSDKQIEGQVKANVDRAKKGLIKAADGSVSEERNTSKGKDLTFLDLFRVDANMGFQRLKVDVPAASNDGELLALYTAFDVTQHQKQAYVVAIEEKMQRFRKSGVKKIGRRYEDAQDGRRVIRDVRVVWYTYASGRPMELVFEHLDGYRPARDQYEKPGTVPLAHEMRDMVMTPGKPEVPPKRTFGTNRPMTDDAAIGVSDEPGAARMVPSELVEAAIAFHEQAWGEKPRIVHVDDRTAWPRSNASK